EIPSIEAAGKVERDQYYHQYAGDLPTLLQPLLIDGEGERKSQNEQIPENAHDNLRVCVKSGTSSLNYPRDSLSTRSIISQFLRPGFSRSGHPSRPATSRLRDPNVPQPATSGSERCFGPRKWPRTPHGKRTDGVCDGSRSGSSSHGSKRAVNPALL